MAIWVKTYLPPEPLPLVGEGFESSILDLKRRANLDKSYHLAKDVAAFANLFGGALIVGASEVSNCVESYHPMARPEVETTQTAYSRAVRDRCSPRPEMDFGYYPVGDGFILTVVVRPSLGMPIGVMCQAELREPGFSGRDAFAFPVRSGTHTKYLLPEQLSMYMNAGIRRIVVLLSGLRKDDVVRLHDTGGFSRPYKFVLLDAERNILRLTNVHESPGFSIPLEAIDAVWSEGDDCQIAHRGVVAGKGEFRWSGRS